MTDGYDRRPEHDDAEAEPLLEGMELPDGVFETEADRPELDEVLFERTASVLRRRVAARRFAVAAGWLVAFGLGFAVARTPGPLESGTGPDFDRVASGSDRDTESVVARRDPSPRDQVGGETGPDSSEVDAIRLEARADAPSIESNERRELLRRAGDAYLGSRGDVGSAVRCYRRMLDLAAADRVDVGTDYRDSWLLIEMKRDRFGI